MRVLRGIESRLSRPTCLALGVFDGVHLGHRNVIGAAVAGAQKTGATPAVLTFDPHPDAVISASGAPPLLTTTEEKIGFLRELGVKLTIIASFDQSFASTPAEDFVSSVLTGGLRARCVVIGADWRFGAGGRGTAALLKQMADESEFAVAVVPPVLVSGQPVSSTRIRKLLLDGQVEDANELLGRRYSLQGEVIIGDGLGRGLGFPTANLSLPADKLIPADGVYAAMASSAGSTPRLLDSSTLRPRWPSLVYIGSRPTIDGARGRRVEVHLLKRRGPVGAPGSTLSVELVSRLRADRRFPSVEALVEQMRADAASARAVLGRHPGRARAHES